jgi:Conserved TM helix/Mechanosensitive ion channel
MTQAQASSTSFGSFLSRVGELLPNIVAALGLILLGWFVAYVARRVGMRLVGAWTPRLAGGVGRLTRSVEAERRLARAGADQRVRAIVGNVVFWVVLLFFLASATEALGLPVITTWLSGIVAYLPQLVAGLVIALLGLLAGNMARGAVTAAASRAGFAYPKFLGGLAQGLILVVTAVVGFDQLGIKITFLIVLAAVATGTMLGSGALAFALGARTAVSNIIGSYYLHQVYQVGHQVVIAGTQGKILEITPTSVIIGTPTGRVVVPAKTFNEESSMLVAE